jgi:Tol biopolymer transport system component
VIFATEPVVTEHILVPPTHTPSPPPPTLYTLAFASNRDGNWNIYLLSQSGKQTHLTNDARDDSYPSWSPNGGKILFHSDRASNFDIYTINPDGTGLKQLTDHSNADTYPSWSPDGKQIVFQSKRDGVKQIYVMNADGSNQRRLMKSEFDDQYPSWSPDGKQIIYSSDIKGSLQLMIVNADGSDPRQLTAGSASGQVILGSDPAQSQRGTVSFSFASWSPDGRWIVAAYATEDKEDIILGQINSRGQFDFQGLTGLARETQPRWSPDGKQVYFVSNAGGNYDIYRINLAGSDLTQITDERSDEEAPSVNPQILTMPGIEVVPVGG